VTKKIFGLAAAFLLMAYLIPSFVSAPYFNYLYARENGFVAWLLFGEVVATVKSFAWPYFALERFNGSSPSDDTTLLLAEQGDAKAQDKLGFAYDTGQGVRQDYAEAVKWYRKAADQGNASAEYNLGSMYANGQGVPQDDADAVKWFRKAADQDNAAAEYDLGSMYRDGRGVPQDYAEAMKWFRKAADRGLAAAENNIGGMYDTGKGVRQDAAEAVKWYRKGADHGSALAQFNLAICYSSGQGVPQDFVQASKWFDLAAAGFPASDTELRTKAIRARDLVASKMTPSQIAEAQALTREWKPQ
jgi:uncharacterized protein